MASPTALLATWVVFLTVPTFFPASVGAVGVNWGRPAAKVVQILKANGHSSKWCVLNTNKDLFNATVQATAEAQAIDACTSVDCSVLSPGGSCFNISWPGNISYAFNSYYQQHDQNADSCNFGGLGLITNFDPSVDSCRFLVQLKTSISVSLHPYALLHLFLLLLSSPLIYTSVISAY